MDSYDPLNAPEAEEWLGLCESLRLELISAFHAREDSGFPGIRLHCAIHLAVENQLAMKDEHAERALSRLSGGGLDRHEAVHAIGTVIAGHLYRLLKGGKAGDDEGPGGEYYDRLDNLTAEKWISGGN